MLLYGQWALPQLRLGHYFIADVWPVIIPRFKSFDNNNLDRNVIDSGPNCPYSQLRSLFLIRIRWRAPNCHIFVVGIGIQRYYHWIEQTLCCIIDINVLCPYIDFEWLYLLRNYVKPNCFETAKTLICLCGQDKNSIVIVSYLFNYGIFVGIPELPVIRIDW